MLERLVENWLDNAGERSYQRCFCQMLTGQGYRIIHNTEHTPLDECGHVYKNLDAVLRVLEDEGIARVARRLYPVANIKGTD